MSDVKFLKPALLLTRLSIFYFLLPWQIKRFNDPEGIDKIASKHYHMPGFSETLSTITGVLFIALLIAFVTGFKKTITYGLVFIVHTGAILISLQAYIYGLESYILIFAAAIPAAAAMGLLWVLRREDTLLSLGGKFG